MRSPDDACPLQVHVARQGTVQTMYTCTLQVEAARGQGGKDQEDRKLVWSFDMFGWEEDTAAKCFTSDSNLQAVANKIILSKM